MKGFIEIGGDFMLDMILLVIFLVVLFTAIGSAFDTNLQVAFLNAELLRSKINEACTNGEAEISGLSLPQSAPSKLGGITDYLPRTFIGLAGDPTYVLYYEAFPPGEAIGWEVYQDEGFRIIAPYAHGESVDIQATRFLVGMNDTVEKILAGFEDKKAAVSDVGAAETTVLIPNVLLTSALNTIPTDATNTPRFLTANKDVKGDLGFWGEDNEENIFVFNNYVRGLSPLEKSLVKYRPCGDNALCLKTRAAVYRFSLDKCTGIKRIELDYSAAADTSSLGKFYGGGLGFVVAGIWSFKHPVKFLAHPFRSVTIEAVLGSAAIDGMFEVVGTSKVSDFYVASPCKLNGDIAIKKVSCSELACKNTHEYPLYDVTRDDDGGLVVNEAGTHTACYGALGDKLDDVSSLSAAEGECIQITVGKVPDGYCWTPDPTLGHPQGGFTKASAALASLFALQPVRESTAYLEEHKAAVLKPNKEVGSKLFELWNSLERLWGWGWPGGGMT